LTKLEPPPSKSYLVHHSSVVSEHNILVTAAVTYPPRLNPLIVTILQTLKIISSLTDRKKYNCHSLNMRNLWRTRLVEWQCWRAEVDIRDCGQLLYEANGISLGSPYYQPIVTPYCGMASLCLEFCRNSTEKSERCFSKI
jgi:hypothetical protein